MLANLWRWVDWLWVDGAYARVFGLPAQQAADVPSPQRKRNRRGGRVRTALRAARARSRVWESIDIMDIIFEGVHPDDHKAISLTSKQLWFALRACA
jgi:hypothetical protein